MIDKLTTIYERLRPIARIAGNECDGWLLDGQQRTTTICEFVAGQIEVRGWRYPDLPDIERRHFDRLTVPVVETSLRTREECEDIYDRLVYGGTPHEPKDDGR